MKKCTRLSAVSLLLGFVLLVPVLMQAQAPAKPYHEGPVWDMQFIRPKAGMDDRYLRYLATDWKKEQEALKQAGLVLDYKVITTESHGPQDYSVILMSQFKDLASLEANADKAEALLEKLFGGPSQVESGYTDRASWRDVLGGRLGREIILTPKGK